MVEYSNVVIERIKRKMDYFKDHKIDLKPSTMSIRIEKQNDMFSQAVRVGDDFTWYSNDTKEVVNGNRGTSPLSYFLSSLGLCQCVHYAEHSIVSNLQLDSLTITVDGTISQNPRLFTDISYTVHISSAESEEHIKELARKAANDCYVTNTVKKGCKVTGFVFLNGKKIDEHH